MAVGLFSYNIAALFNLVNSSFYKVALFLGDFFSIYPFLVIFSILFDYFIKYLFVGLVTKFFIDKSIFSYPKRDILIAPEFAVFTFIAFLFNYLF